MSIMKRNVRFGLSVMLILLFLITSLGFAAIPLKGIKLNASNISLQAGKTYNLKVSYVPSNTTQKLLAYSSANKNVATVDKNGKIKAIKSGKTTVTIISASNNKISSKCIVTVSKADTIVNKTGFPIVNEKVKVTLILPKNLTNKTPISEVLWYKRMEEKTNIQLKVFEVPAAAFVEKRNLAIVSNDLPDIFYNSTMTYAAIPFNNFEEARYSADGILIQLDNLIDNYAPILKDIMNEAPVIKKGIRLLDGHIYTLPYLAKVMDQKKPGQGLTEIPFYNINKEWLKTLNLKMPTTVNEWYNILKAFKEKDPNQNNKADEIPFISAGLSGIREAMPWFGIFADLFADNGKIYYGQATENYKQFLKFFKKIYAEKLYYNDSINLNSEQMTAIGTADVQRLGSFFTSGSFVVVGEKNYVNYGAIPPLVAENGKQWIRGRDGITTGVFAITKRCKIPAAMMRWIDYQYSDEGATLPWLGIENVDFKYDSNGATYRLTPQGMTEGDFANTFAGPTVLVPAAWNKTSSPTTKDLFDNRYGVLLKYSVPPLPKIRLTQEKLQRNSVITTDINKYVSEYMVNAIVGLIDIDKTWDNYISTLQKMGLDELISSNQKALDDYNK